MRDAYVHGYDAHESRRLHDQARTLADLLHQDTRYPPGSTVIEVGCGVGAQTVTLAAMSPGARILAVDISDDSVAQARARVEAAGLTNVALARGDLLALPYPDGSFDHAFVCFVLEHLPDPAAALAVLRRLVRPGGTVTAIEGDHGSVLAHPDDPTAHEAIAAQVELQRRAGGDALIGRRLGPLLRAAGFSDVRVSPRVVHAEASRPELVEGFTRCTFTAMIEGVRAPALAAGLIAPERFDAGIRALERTTEPDGTFSYTFFKATGVRADPAW
ncbi:MAG TPA: methyltransferase domain-containing protein [Salinarimonas sp.]|nr:methyltransferase domain-containing protein [Salinarimonas sp.]